MAGEKREGALGGVDYIGDPSTRPLFDPLLLPNPKRNRSRYLATRSTIYDSSPTVLRGDCHQARESVRTGTNLSDICFNLLISQTNRCFHLDDIGHLPEQWTSLCSYLHKNTKGRSRGSHVLPRRVQSDSPSRNQGNPFDLKWNLSTLVRDGDIAFSYQSQEWTVRKTVLNSHPDLSAEDFAAR